MHNLITELVMVLHLFQHTCNYKVSTEMNNEGRKVGKSHITNGCKCLTKKFELYTEATNLICREEIKHFY